MNEQSMQAQAKRKSLRNDEQKRLIYNRLNRAVGQLGGIKRLVEEDAYCPDILIQIAAVKAALSGLSKELLLMHLGTDIAADLKDGKEDSLHDLEAELKKIL